jgi:hypothetical protein
MKDFNRLTKREGYLLELNIYGHDYTSDEMYDIGKQFLRNHVSSLIMHNDNFNNSSLDDLSKGINGITCLRKIYFYELNVGKIIGFNNFVRALGDISMLTYLNMRQCGKRSVALFPRKGK